MVKLAASMLVAFIYQVIPLSEGRLEGKKESPILDNIVPDIVAYAAAESIRLLFIGYVSGIYQGTE